MMSPAFTQQVTLSEDALFQEVGGEIVILDLKSDSYFGLNEVGARIWQLMQEHGALQPVFEAVLDEFDVDEDQLQKDMQALLNDLASAELITLTE